MTCIGQEGVELDHEELGRRDREKVDSKSCEFQFSPQLSLYTDQLSTCLALHRLCPFRCEGHKVLRMGVSPSCLAILAAFTLRNSSWISNSGSPGVIIGDMVVLAKESLESPFCWEVTFVAVSKMPFTNLARTDLCREKSDLTVHQVCGIAAFAQQLWQENLVWVETSGLKSFNRPSLNTQPPRVEASQESRPGWGALWADIGFGKPHTISAQLLHSRCLEIWVVP